MGCACSYHSNYFGNPHWRRNLKEIHYAILTWKDFQARNNNELVAVYGNFVNRALVLTDKYFDGKVPAIIELTDYDKQTINEFIGVKEEVEKLLNVFKFRDAQKEAMNLARIGNKYLADTEP